MSDNDDDEVGYGQPPKQHRFQKGRSGNPSGRPRGSSATGSFTKALDRVLKQNLNVKMQGVATQMSTMEAIVQQLASKAVSGDMKALCQIVAIEKQRGTFAPPPPEQAPCGVLVVERYLTQEEWYAHASAQKAALDPLEGLPGIDPEAMRKAAAEKRRIAEEGYDDGYDDGTDG